MFGITDKQEPTYFEGTIADNEDPEFWGRVRVHIIGKTEGLSGEDLPFARVLHPLSNSLNISDVTSEIGTRVLLIRLNNDWNSLIVLGQLKQLSQKPQ